MAATYPDLIPVPATGVRMKALLALVWRAKPSPAAAALLTAGRRAFRSSEPR